MNTTPTGAKQKFDDAIGNVTTMKDDLVADAANRAKSLSTSAADKIDQAQASGVQIVNDIVTSMNARLQELGIDTEVMVKAAKSQAADLTDLVAQEIKARPMRALGAAAVFGIVVGLMTAR